MPRLRKYRLFRMWTWEDMRGNGTRSPLSPNVSKRAVNTLQLLTYTLSDKGFVIVENQCKKDGKDGKETGVKGKAFVVKNSGNAKLKVQFFWPFKGKYWIIDLADDYSYAVVSHPKKKYLWILARAPQMNKELYEQILSRLTEKGFDLSKLEKTVQ